MAKMARWKKLKIDEDGNDIHLKLDPEMKKIWLEALDSGEYKQGKGSLCVETKSGPRFCCLGVAADVLGEGEWVFGKRYNKWGYRDSSRGNTAKGMLPNSLARRMNLHPDTQQELADMNDGGKRFSTIRKFIDENL